MLTPELVPMRFAPASTMVRNWAAVRMPPRGFHAERVADHATHKSDIGNGGSRTGETGGGLHEIGSRIHGESAAKNFFFLSQKTVLKDDLQQRVAFVGQFGEQAHFGLHEHAVARLQCPNVDHHLQLSRAIVQGCFRFGKLGNRQAGAQRKADNRSDLNRMCRATERQRKRHSRG